MSNVHMKHKKNSLMSFISIAISWIEKLYSYLFLFPFSSSLTNMSKEAESVHSTKWEWKVEEKKKATKNSQHFCENCSRHFPQIFSRMLQIYNKN